MSSRYKTPEQIINILRQVEVMLNQGLDLTLACKKAEINPKSYYRWRKQYGGMQVSEAKELKKLQEENAKLKRIIADLV